MKLLKSHTDALPEHEIAVPVGSPHSSSPRSNSFVATLLGEEKHVNMLILLSILVPLLHVCGYLWLGHSNNKQVSEPKPLKMQVSMIAISAPKPIAAPPQPAPPPSISSPEKKPVKKPQSKPLPKKAPPIVQKSPDFAPSEPVTQPQPAAQSASSTQTTQSTQGTGTANSKPTSTASTEQFTEANFRANYAQNPKPEYPAIAKSRGWQGKVMLRVQVSAKGLSDAVSVEESSGRQMLDEAAVEAVKKWQFIPAKRGETPVSSSVVVPIIFSLRD